MFFNHSHKEEESSIVATKEIDKVLWDNEVQANKQVAAVMLLCMIFMVISWLLNKAGVYTVDEKLMTFVSLLNLIILLIPYMVCRKCEGRKKGLKYFMIIALIISYCMTDMLLTYTVVMIMAIPVVLSSRYYDWNLTRLTAVLSSIGFGLSTFLGAYIGTVDANKFFFKEGTVLQIHGDVLSSVTWDMIDWHRYLKDMMLHGFLPRYFMFLVIALIAVEIARRGHEMVLKQNQIAKEHARIDTELNLAKGIQEHTLPVLEELGEHTSFDLAAFMQPAKEIGGDFYDFIMLDDRHLALVIADVSGKGVPAAMFMMVSKIMIHNALQEGKMPGQVLSEVNSMICEKNQDNMFVTVWLGIIDLTNGEVVTANGGHEYPLLCKKDGSFEVLKDKHGLALGAFDGINYPETRFTLAEGDILFVYTDGIPESNDPSGNQYTLDRARHTLDIYKESSMADLLTCMHESVIAFSGTAEQFDDLTMLGLRINNYMKN